MRYTRYALAVTIGLAIGVLVTAILGASPRPSLLPALVGIGGVAVGATVATVGEFILYRLRRTDDLERAEEARSVRVREAARMVLAELIEVKAYSETCVKYGRVGLIDRPAAQQEFAQWNSYRGLLSGEGLTYDETTTVAKAVLAAQIAFYIVSATVFPVLILAGVVESRLSYTSGFKAEPEVSNPLRATELRAMKLREYVRTQEFASSMVSLYVGAALVQPAV